MSTYAVKVIPGHGGTFGWLCDHNADVLLFNDIDHAMEVVDEKVFPGKMAVPVRVLGSIDPKHATEVEKEDSGIWYTT